MKSIIKQILKDELSEQSHPVPVEEVIFEALKHYSDAGPNGGWHRIISYSITQRILDAQKETICKHEWEFKTLGQIGPKVMKCKKCGFIPK